MALLPIKIYGEEVLREQRTLVFTPAVHPALHPGRSACIRRDGTVAGWLGGLHPGVAKGLGLAANQVGRASRVFAIDLSQFDVLAEPKVIINPEIMEKSNDLVTAEEGCLSFPGLFQVIERPDKVTIKSINLDGKEYFFEAKGLVARVLQHEIDHLNGVLFIDKLTSAQRALIKRKLTRIRAGERV